MSQRGVVCCTVYSELVDQGESLLHVPGGEAVHSWAGSLERFLAEFSHGRGLGILHPNLNGAVSFARQVPSGTGTGWEEEEEMLSQTQTEGASTPTPTLRGTEEGEREPETLIRTYKDANNLVVSTVPFKARMVVFFCGSHGRVCFSPIQ